jgi:photosystem II stability/assembly factor-like uncharacterized protein
MYRKFIGILYSFLTISILFAAAAKAQTAEAKVIKVGGESDKSLRFGDWRTVGPNGGDVRSIVVDPTNSQHFYFTTLDGQIYTSTDGGANWRLLYNFNRSMLVLDNLKIDVRDSKIIYAAGYVDKSSGGFFKSKDGGATWRESKEMRNHAIYAMTQSDKNPDMLLLGANDGVFASFDAGENWQKISDEKKTPGLIEVDSLAVDPRNTDVIYAGTTYRPYKTTDGGKNWRLISKGMIDDSDVFAIDISPRDPDTIFASACSGIYLSKNAGEQWTKVQGIPSTARRTRDILQHPSDPKYVYAGTTEGFWMSADGGATWSLTTTRQLEVNSITVHPNTPEKVYIGTNNYGVMVSNDYGKSFTQTNGGYSTRQANLIAADLEQPNRFYATTNNTATGGGFFFISKDGGATWQAAMKNFPRTTVVYSILQDSANPNTIYLGTINGIYRSLDRGESWAAVSGTIRTAAASRKTNSPRRRTAAAAASSRGRATATRKTATVVKSTTAAKPAAKVATLTERVNALVPTYGEKKGLWAATNKGLYRSYDLSAGWERISLPPEATDEILTMAVSPASHLVVWIGTARAGVWSSRDGGTTWRQESGIPKDYPISHIEADSTDAYRVYVGTKQTFYMTRDAEKWERRGGGLPAGEYNSIVINPNNSNEIFVGSAMEGREGLFHTIDGGRSWERVDSSKLNLPSRRIWALSLDPRNTNVLLVGSHSAGIYRVERSSTVSANE